MTFVSWCQWTSGAELSECPRDLAFRRRGVAIPLAQQRKLLQRSGNMCAFPDCRVQLTAEGTPEDPVVVLGEIAHIVAESPGGPRGKSPLTAKQRNSYPNLILLCNQHHQLIDSEGALATYTVERLTAMKQDHETWVERALRGRRNAADELPPMVQDTVYSNLLPVRQMPRYIYGAPCPAAREGDVIPKAIGDTVMMPFIIRGGWLWAFQDLRDEKGPFSHAVIAAEAEEHLTAEWYAEADRLGWYIALLNRCLNKLTGRLGLRFDRDHQRYYFEPDEPGVAMAVTYRPLNAKKATRSVVWQPKKKSTGEPRGYWLHRAVQLRFIQAAPGTWLLSIRPELRVTSDGSHSIEAQGIGRRVTRSKSRMFNYDLLGEVQFWRDFLGRSTSAITLPFGSSHQQMLIATSLGSSRVRWPGIPEEHAKPFRNVDYLDDQLAWAEAEGLPGEDDDEHEPGDEPGACDDRSEAQVTA
jgi:hypothetical protein